MSTSSSSPPDNRPPRTGLVIVLVLLSFLAAIFLWRRNVADLATLAAPAPDAVAGSARPPSEPRPRAGTFKRQIATQPLRRLPGNALPAAEETDQDPAAAAAAAEVDPPAEPVSPETPRGRTGTLNTGLAVDRGAVRGRIKLRGTPAPEKPLPLDALCSALHSSPPTTRFFVVGGEGELADVFIWISEGLENLQAPPPGAPVLLDQIGCQYTPYVLGLQTQQKLMVRNSDRILHNVHAIPAVAGNRESNRAQPARFRDLEFRFEQPELMLRFKCDVHPWMFAYVSVLDHHFFAVSDSRGEYTIPNVPAGQYRLEAFHRRAGRTSEVIIVTAGNQHTQDFVLNVPSLSDR